MIIFCIQNLDVHEVALLCVQTICLQMRFNESFISIWFVQLNVSFTVGMLTTSNEC